MRKIILITMLTLISRGLVAQTVQRNQFADYVEWLQINNPPLGNFINNWLGVKYKLGGSTKKGIDCSQFNKRLYKDVYGLDLKDVCYQQWYQIHNATCKCIGYRSNSIIFCSFFIHLNLEHEIF